MDGVSAFCDHGRRDEYRADSEPGGHRPTSISPAAASASQSADTRALAFRLASTPASDESLSTPGVNPPRSRGEYPPNKLTRDVGLETTDGRESPPTELVASLPLFRPHQFVEP
jgi:hypothetical protein